MKKDERFGLVLTRAEKEVAAQMAESEGVSLAAFIRFLIRKAAVAGKLWKSTISKGGFGDAES